MKFVAVILVLLVPTLAHADRIADKSAEFKRLTSHYTLDEQVFAMFASWEVINGYCKNRLGKSVWDSPGSATVLIAGLLSVGTGKLPVGRAGEIYDFIWNWTNETAGPILKTDPVALQAQCDAYRQTIGQFVQKTLK